MAVTAFFRRIFGRPASPKFGSKGEAGLVAASAARKSPYDVVEPMLMNIKSAERSFYRSLFGEETGDCTNLLSQTQLLDDIRMSLSQSDSRRKAVPRLPSVIPRLMQTLRDPHASAKDFVKIINKDPVMSAAVLKMANSAYFNPANQAVTGIGRAVVMLGIEGLRTVLSTAVMQPIIQRKTNYFSEFGHRLWVHSLCCAVACELLAKKRGLKPFKAYMMGLTHDIGKITLFSELCKQLQAHSAKQLPGFHVFVPWMTSLSAPLSLWIVQDWELPEEISEALAEQADLTPGKQLSPYGHLLYQVNLVCEVFASGQHNNPELAQHLIEEMSLPSSIFDILEQVSVDV